jgi:predicted O-methyltransferase YrrM
MLTGKFYDAYNSNNALGYILTRKGAQNYVNYIIQNGFKYAADFDMTNYLIEKNIYYGSRYVLVTSNPRLGSDIFPHINNDNNNDNKLTYNNSYLNYGNMYNWTNDLPPNTDAKLTFVKMLTRYIKLYNNCKILEIGTFVGTSIIAMLQYLPRAHATTIDKWSNYIEKYNNGIISSLNQMVQNNVEQIFFDNIEKAGVKNRINAMKGDSSNLLLELIKKNNIFDIIYVDGSHTCIDCYTDCLLAWQILNKNGLLIIDDYLYKQYTNDDNILDRPFHGINHFLEKMEGTYTILEKGYRIFLLKL